MACLILGSQASSSICRLVWLDTCYWSCVPTRTPTHYVHTRLSSFWHCKLMGPCELRPPFHLLALGTLCMHIGWSPPSPRKTEIEFNKEADDQAHNMASPADWHPVYMWLDPLILSPFLHSHSSPVRLDPTVSLTPLQAVTPVGGWWGDLESLSCCLLWIFWLAHGLTAVLYWGWTRVLYVPGLYCWVSFTWHYILLSICGDWPLIM